MKKDGTIKMFRRVQRVEDSPVFPFVAWLLIISMTTYTILLSYELSKVYSDLEDRYVKANEYVR